MGSYLLYRMQVVRLYNVVSKESVHNMWVPYCSVLVHIKRLMGWKVWSFWKCCWTLGFNGVVILIKSAYVWGESYLFCAILQIVFLLGSWDQHTTQYSTRTPHMLNLFGDIQLKPEFLRSSIMLDLVIEGTVGISLKILAPPTQHILKDLHYAKKHELSFDSYAWLWYTILPYWMLGRYQNEPGSKFI